MRVLFHVHKWPPIHNAGAEWYCHSVARWLADRSHDVAVVNMAATGETEFEGIPVFGGRYTTNQHERADVVITHLDATRQAIRAARRVASKPLVHVIHNHRQLEFWNVRPDECTLAVFNSQWVARQAKWRGPQVVLPPPVFAADYAVSKGAPEQIVKQAITLVNLTEAKGAPTFYALAERMADRQFIGVVGAYGAQEPAPTLTNLQVVANSPAMRDVYAQTAVLLMPSSYESWGRVAIEAAASGIPTIAHPTPGLREALGRAGTFAMRDNIDKWEALLRRLEDPEHYAKVSRLSLARSLELDPEPGLVDLERRLAMVAAAYA